jgi:hypothetical protein
MTPDAYMRKLLEDARRDERGGAPVSPALFRLDHEIYADLDHTHPNTAPPSILINPAFQNVLDFTLHTQTDIAALEYVDPRQTIWRVSVMGGLAEFTMQGNAPLNPPQYVDLAASHRHLSMRRATAHYGGLVTIRLTNCLPKAVRGAPRDEQVATLSIDASGQLIARENMPITWRHQDGNGSRSAPAAVTRRVQDGEVGTTRTSARQLPDKVTIAVHRDASLDESRLGRESRTRSIRQARKSPNAKSLRLRWKQPSIANRSDGTLRLQWNKRSVRRNPDRP